VARVIEASEIFAANIFKRQFGQDRNAIIALLTARNHVVVTKGGKALKRDLFNWRFAFLKAEHIRPMFGQQFAHKWLAQAHRIDIPCGQ
jgi:hypothetical protein